MKIGKMLAAIGALLGMSDDEGAEAAMREVGMPPRAVHTPGRDAALARAATKRARRGARRLAERDSTSAGRAPR